MKYFSCCLALLMTTVLLNGCLFFEPSRPQNDNQREFQSVFLNHSQYYINQSELRNFNTYNYDLNLFYAGIKDHYTRYYTPQQADSLNLAFANPSKQAILGFRYQYLHLNDSIPDTIRVMDVYANSPAQTMGLQNNDLILYANQMNITGDSALLFPQAIAGGIGTKIQFIVLRNLNIDTLQGAKDTIAVPTVLVDSVAPGISKILITQFSNQTIEKTSSVISGTWLEFRQALLQTSSEKVSLLDLRGNPGGSVPQCEAIANEFLPKGDLIIQELPYDNGFAHSNIISDGQGTAINRSFVVLADSNSASCAEILISALRDNTNFPLVGTHTFGKGIGQGFYGTYLGGYTKITSLKFLNQANRSYQGVGITPTVQVMNPDAQLDTAIAIAQSKGTALSRVNPKPFFSNHSISIQLESQPSIDLGGAYRFVK